IFNWIPLILGIFCLICFILYIFTVWKAVNHVAIEYSAFVESLGTNRRRLQAFGLDEMVQIIEGKEQEPYILLPDEKAVQAILKGAHSISVPYLLRMDLLFPCAFLFAVVAFVL